MKRLIAFLMAFAMLLCMTACGGSGDADNGGEADVVDAAPAVELSAVYESMGDVLPEMMVMDEGSMLNYYGVDAAACKQVVLAICADGLRADEVWLAEAKDADSLKELQSMAESRLAAKEEETINYTPDQYEIVKEAELYTEGMYLVFLVSPDVDTLKSLVDEAIS